MSRVGMVRFYCSVAMTVMLASAAAGDGFYSPEADYQASVGIPFQEAVVVHHNSTETLVVRSGLQAASKTVGWVLPLPAPPTEMRVVEVQEMLSLAREGRREVSVPSPVFSPSIDIDVGFGIAVPVLPVVAAASLLAFFLLTRGKGRLVWGEMVLLLVLTVILSVILLAPDTLLKSRATLLASRRVGEYEVAVLRATSADDLAGWLRASGLREPDEVARGLIEDYIGRGWCFAVAVMARDAYLDGRSLYDLGPRPLCVTFPAVSPVYPMKLTSLAESQTMVDLAVVADNQAKADGFETIGCDVLQPLPEHPAVFQGRVRGLTARLGENPSFLWDGCIVTRLRRTFQPEEMNRDITFEMVEPRPGWTWTLRSESRHALAGDVAFTGLILFGVGATAFHFRGRKPRTWERWTLTGLTVAVLAGAGFVYLVLP